MAGGFDLAEAEVLQPSEGLQHQETNDRGGQIQDQEALWSFLLVSVELLSKLTYDKNTLASK